MCLSIWVYISGRSARGPGGGNGGVAVQVIALLLVRPLRPLLPPQQLRLSALVVEKTSGLTWVLVQVVS